jgi:uncharacterized repeat protein (TIGR03803 family)
MTSMRALLTAARLPAIVATLLFLGGSALAARPIAPAPRAVVNGGVMAGGSADTLVWRFGRADREPSSGLAVDGAGNLYGESSSGSGVVYELSPPAKSGAAWTQTLLHRFFGGFYGCSPGGGLILDGVGNLYGIAGCGVAGGGGIVFRLERPKSPRAGWVETVLYAFKPTRGGSGDGAYPHGRLVFDKLGNLYGTTVFGGSHGYGAIYKLAPPVKQGDPWNETVIYNFKGVRHGIQYGILGYYPDHGMIIDAAGALYGTTTSGGSLKGACGGDCGTIFKLTPPTQGAGWKYSVIHFFGLNDGYDPECELIVDGSGNLFGTTEYGGGSTGGGTVFELSPPSKGHAWQETVLYRFPQYAGDSDYPQAGVVLDGAGNVYGTSQYGGPIFEGTIFRLTPNKSKGAWTESVLHTFAGGNDGSYPTGELTYGAGGRLYGATQYGGAGRCPGGKYRGCGTVFAITP